MGHEELGVHFKFGFDDEAVRRQFDVSVSSSDSERNSIIASQPFLSPSTEPGVNALEVSILGSLFGSVPSKFGTSVQPIVAFVKPSKLHQIKRSDLIDDLLSPQPSEVARVFCVPIDELTNPRNQIEENLERRGATIRLRVPSSPCGDIWGLTGFL